MKTNLLLFIFAIAACVAFGQTKETPKSEEKPLRKIATGNGAKQIEEDVEREVARAMRDLDVELKDLDIRIEREVLESLEGLDEQIEASLEGLDEQIEASLEGLDVEIERSVESSLESLEHLDFDFDFNFDQDFDFDFDRNINIDVNDNHDDDIERFRREALRGVNDDEKQEMKKDDAKKDTKDKSKDKQKKDPKEN